MTATIHHFSDSTAAARRLAAEIGIECRQIAVHRFPDGESLVRAAPSAGTAIVYRSLDHPDAKLIELLLAASALRDGGARKIILIAPYLAYMRQDIAFHPGEAVSQKVIGRLMATHFDGLITVDPHLHRTHDLQEIVPGIDALAVSAAGTIADMLRTDMRPDTILIGPDSESRPWVTSVAEALGADMLVAEKRRFGDRNVTLVIPGIERVRGCPAIIVDDLISSGATLLQCATLLREAGASGIEAAATHCLGRPGDLDALARGGIQRIRSVDTVDGPTASAPIAAALAHALRNFPAFTRTSHTPRT
ncbi:ribose-phosphate pyrophosphokinase [Sphingomonas sp. YR710]|uniref:ribose-phosphate diphosphokinase n=1 Tax=Sphingomonas sp. YR710 TaxID=1882773 RepID=UPI0008868EDD|nr:ribose-phosphate diphosphokinase [Sphingomonas sp. YR710]SDC42938.1 ribose-phosphate pyrophosphokinase [Sphingomonas sp. YR710]